MFRQLIRQTLDVAVDIVVDGAYLERLLVNLV
jgi:hypothetical protein